MKQSIIKLLGYANICLAFICLLSWLLNTLGYIRLGEPTAQLIIAPVCIAVGIMVLRPKKQTDIN
jgi:hypothetical protein